MAIPSRIKVYLGGPIVGRTDTECKSWREGMKVIFPRAIDPLRRDYRKGDRSYREVIEMDKRDVLRADVLLVNYNGPSVGTSMEILLAWQNHIPIVLVVPPSMIIESNPWLMYHATKIVRSFPEATEWIQTEIDHGRYPDPRQD